MTFRFQSKGINKSRIFQIILVLIAFAYAWVISGWNTYNTDLINYNIRFNYVDLKSYFNYDSNYGISFLFALLKSWGFDFFYSRLIIYGVFYALLAFVTLKMCKNAFVVFVLYLGFELVRDTVEMKNFMGLVTSIFAVYILSYQTIKHRLLAFFFLWLATTFHNAYFVYILLPLIPFKKKLSFSVLILVYLFSALYSKQIFGGLLSIYSTTTIDSRVETMMRYSGYGAFIASLFVVSCSFLLFYYIFNETKIVLKEKGDLVNVPAYQGYSLFMYNLNVLGAALIVPATMSFSIIGRLYAVIVFLNIVYCLNFFSFRSKGAYRYSLLFFALYYLIILQTITMDSGHYHSVFDNNRLLYPYD